MELIYSGQFHFIHHKDYAQINKDLSTIARARIERTEDKQPAAVHRNRGNIGNPPGWHPHTDQRRAAHVAAGDQSAECRDPTI